jgi:hypothetical protein
LNIFDILYIHVYFCKENDIFVVLCRDLCGIEDVPINNRTKIYSENKHCFVSSKTEMQHVTVGFRYRFQEDDPVVKKSILIYDGEKDNNSHG